MTPVVLIIGLAMLLLNLIWTATIYQNISQISEFVEGKTEFTRIVQELADSKVVDRFTFVAGGYIKSIEDRTLIIENGDSTMEIPVIADAQIVKQTEREAIPETIAFEELRVDDTVSCLVEMDKDGIWSAYRVKIMAQ